jgi:hypothetical protein
MENLPNLLIVIGAVGILCLACAGILKILHDSFWGNTGHCEDVWADCREKLRVCQSCGGVEFEPSQGNDLLMQHVAIASLHPAGDEGTLLFFPGIPLNCKGCGQPLN